MSTFHTLGIKIVGGQVGKTGLAGGLLGSLAGAQAEISDPTRHRRVASSLATTAVMAPVLGPLPLLGLASKKSKAIAFVVFPDGTVHQKNLDGNMMIRAATREVVQFNAQANAALARPGRQDQQRASGTSGAPPSAEPKVCLDCVNMGCDKAMGSSVSWTRNASKCHCRAHH